MSTQSDFVKFEENVRSIFNSNSTPGSTANLKVRVMESEFLIELYKAVAHTTRLGRAMNATEERLEGKGVTPQAIPMRAKNGDVLKDANGDIRWATKGRHAQMWTLEKYHESRKEQTGLKTEEVQYLANWIDLPQGLKDALANKLPLKKDDKPEFQPFALGFVYRKGNKPAKGKSRHAWKRPQWVVLGSYGDDPEGIRRVMVVTGAVSWLSGRTSEFAKAIGVEEAIIPSWETQASAVAYAKAQDSNKAFENLLDLI